MKQNYVQALKGASAGKALFCAAGFSSLFILFAPSAHAATIRGAEEYELSAETELSGDLYAGGRAVTLKGDVTGDLVAAGASVFSRGQVAGDALLAGGTVTVEGGVKGDLRVAAGEAFVTGSTSEDVIVAAGTVIIDRNAHIGGDLVVFADRLVVRGLVVGMVEAHARTVELDGEMRGPVSITAREQVSVLDRAVLTQTLTYKAPRRAFVTEGAELANEPEYTEHNPGAAEKGDLAVVGFMFRFLILAAGASLLFALFPKLAERMLARAFEKSGVSLAWGFISVILAPLAALILCITIVGLLPGLVVFGVWATLLAVAKLLTALFAGSMFAMWLGKGSNLTYGWIVLGAVALAALAYLPFIGPLANIALFILAYGALTTELYERYWKTRRA